MSTGFGARPALEGQSIKECGHCVMGSAALGQNIPVAVSILKVLIRNKSGCGVS